MQAARDDSELGLCTTALLNLASGATMLLKSSAKERERNRVERAVAG